MNNNNSNKKLHTNRPITLYAYLKRETLNMYTYTKRKGKFIKYLIN